MRPHRLSSHRKAEAKAGPIVAAPFSKGLKEIAFALRNAPAFVCDLHHEPLAPRAGPEHAPSAGVFLKALCSRFMTADASSWGSA